MRLWIGCFLASLLGGCAAVGGGNLPKTMGERASNYGYVPLDPLPIETTSEAGSCEVYGGGATARLEHQKAFKPLLQALPDIAVRFAVAELSDNGQLEFGPAKVTVKHKAYRAVLDYTNADSVTLNFLIRKSIRRNGVDKWVPVSMPVDSSIEKVLAFEARVIPVQRKRRLNGATELPPELMVIAEGGQSKASEDGWERVAFPIYVGLGLRLTADIRALEGGIALNGLTAIGIQADAKGLTGTMTLQTLGVNGLPMTTALATPSKLDQTTIEQSILAIGTGRAIIYTDSVDNKVSLDPRVVGLYSPVGSDSRLINAVYSELSTVRVPWPRPCKEAE